MSQRRTMEEITAEIVADYEPAEGITTLDTALRLITGLRQQIRDQGEQGTMVAKLDTEMMDKLKQLYDGKCYWFAYGADLPVTFWDDPPEFRDAFVYFTRAGIETALTLMNMQKRSKEHEEKREQEKKQARKRPSPEREEPSNV